MLATRAMSTIQELLVVAVVANITSFYKKKALGLEVCSIVVGPNTCFNMHFIIWEVKGEFISYILLLGVS